jgi:hypothetical protein
MNSTRLIAMLVLATLALSACGTSTASATPGGSGAQASKALASKAPASKAPASSGSPAAASAAPCEPLAKPFDPKKIDLTGAWAGDDGGIYYLRQVKSVLWWNGMSERDGPPLRLGRDWNNVARGDIKGLVIDVVWADVPRGNILGNGTMNLKIEGDAAGNIRIAKVSETGSGFGNRIFTPCKPS